MNKSQLIPKKIHYFWFGGGKKGELFHRCKLSWEKYAPGYEIIEWNESNCNINEVVYSKQAYDAKKWAFVSDYFRLKVLYEQGGFYADTDMEFNQSIDSLRAYPAFFPFETQTDINACFFGCLPGNDFIKTVLESYKNSAFADSKGRLNIKYNIVVRITEALTRSYEFEQNGLTQVLSDGITLLSPNILVINVFDGKNITEHHYEATWWDPLTVSVPYKSVILKNYFGISDISEYPRWKRVIYLLLFDIGTFRRKLLNKLKRTPKLYSLVIRVYTNLNKT